MKRYKMKLLAMFTLFVTMISCQNIQGETDFNTKNKILIQSDIESKIGDSTNYLLIRDIDKNKFDLVKSYSFNYDVNEEDSLMSLGYNTFRKPLEINTNRGKVIFKNISPDYEDKQCNYFNFGFLNKEDKHLIYVAYYEDDEYLLIDNATAQIDTVIGRPFFSPDSDKIFSFRINPFAEVEVDNEFVIISDIEVSFFSNRIIKNKLKKQIQFIPIEIKWENNNTILLKVIDSFTYTQIASTGSKKLSDIETYEYKSITITEK